MPYIPNDQTPPASAPRRERIDPTHGRDYRYVGAAENVGELNFQITRLCDDFVERTGGTNYGRINAVIGALECAKLEFYRRIAAPHEDTKRNENGDVYEARPK